MYHDIFPITNSINISNYHCNLQILSPKIMYLTLEGKETHGAHHRVLLLPLMHNPEKR